MVLDVSTGICLGLACSSCEASKSPGHSLETTQDFTKASEASWSYSCDSKVSFDRVQILPPDILRPHSLTLTLTLSLSHCLTVSLISLISLISFSSLSSLSPLSLSLLSVSRLSVSLLSLLSQEDPGKEPHIKDSSPLPPKRAPCFFLPRCPPLSHSGALAFAPPWPQV